jgi:hypothetical protein
MYKLSHMQKKRNNGICGQGRSQGGSRGSRGSPPFGNIYCKIYISPQFVVQIKVFVQYSRKNWAILAHKKAKKRKSPQFVFPIKVVVQYSRKN